MPSTAPPRARFGSVSAAIDQASIGELPAMMVDPQRLPHAVRRAGAGEQGDGERKAIGATSRRTVTASAAIAASIGSSGATATAVCSAIRPPNKGVSSSFSPAIGRSTSRDQWMLAPASADAGARSYQPWPASRRADLHHPHIVVGVAEREDADRAPAVEQHEGGDDRARSSSSQQPPAGGPENSNCPPAAPVIQCFFSFQPLPRALVAVAPKGKRAHTVTNNEADRASIRDPGRASWSASA